MNMSRIHGLLHYLLRHELQGTADQAFTRRDPLNTAQCKAFGLKLD
jgi:hypothetical protein